MRHGFRPRLTRKPHPLALLVSRWLAKKMAESYIDPMLYGQGRPSAQHHGPVFIENWHTMRSAKYTHVE